MTKLRQIFAAIILSLLSLLPQPALAVKGVTISPPFQDITLTKNQPLTSFSYSVTNNDPTRKTFDISARDFGSLDESGGVAFLAVTPGEVNSHGLVNWLSLGATTLILDPGETKTVSATIKNTPQFEPGGHYGAILVSEKAPSVTSQDGRVVVRAVLSTLLFVDKLGGEKYGLKLDSLKTLPHWWSSPSLELRFVNNGNIDVVPRGVVKLLDPKGREVARAAVNEESARILPGSYRRFTVPLVITRPITAPGKYQLVTQYRYDGKSQFADYHTNLFYFPIGATMLLVAIILGLIIAAILGRWGFKLFKKSKPQQ